MGDKRRQAHGRSLRLRERRQHRPGRHNPEGKARRRRLYHHQGREGVGHIPGGRNELKMLLQFLRAGGTLCVTRIDRLARSMRDLQNIVHELKERGVYLRATEQPIDTSTAAGKVFLDTMRRERQMEGITKAKAEGRYVGKGRPKSIRLDEVRALKAAGKRPTEIAEELKISRASATGR
jgi:DNA invertase Pin-like site-specific DNA recombinase